MSAYGNLHMAFEQMRVRALRSFHGSPVPDDESIAEPPRVLILGPENSGKTTVAKILTNYAVRSGQGWAPILINVDPGEVSTPAKVLVWPSLKTLGRLGSSWNNLRSSYR